MAAACEAPPLKEAPIKIKLGRDTSGRPLYVDKTTLEKLRYAEAMSGLSFVIVQGSWRGGKGAKASAGTHDRGGVIDLRSRDFTSEQKQLALLWLRRAGLIAWLRTKAQGFDEHFHAIDYGNPDLHPTAADQVLDWKNGRNGLASNGPDDGPDVDIPKTCPTIPAPEKPMTVRALHDSAITACTEILKQSKNPSVQLRVRRAAFQLRKSRDLFTPKEPK